MDDIRDMYFAAMNKSPSAIADEVDTRDPMLELDDNERLPTEAAPTRKRNRSRNDSDTPAKRRANAQTLRKQVVTLDVPRYSPSAHPHNTDKITINAFISGGRGLGEIWIGQKDIQWLLS